MGIALLILFMTLGGRTGWTTPVVLILLLSAIASLMAFVYVEKSARRPILDLSLLRHRVLTPTVISSFLMYMATFVNLFILPFYVSDILGVNAKSLGFLLMLTPAISAASAPIGGWLSDRIAPAYISTFALVTVSASLLSFSVLGTGSSIADVAVRMAILGFGFGVFQASSANLIMGSVPSDRLGTGGAALSLSRSMGTVTSVALISALFAARLDTHAISLATQGAAGAVADSQAFVMAFSDTYRIASVIGALGAIVSITCWPGLIKLQPTDSTDNRP
jgi:predicted MFS family arabinose efflux permease